MRLIVWSVELTHACIRTQIKSSKDVRRAILRPDVVPLPVLGGGVVAVPQHRQQLSVSDCVRVLGFIVCRLLVDWCVRSMIQFKRLCAFTQIYTHVHTHVGVERDLHRLRVARGAGADCDVCGCGCVGMDGSIYG